MQVEHPFRRVVALAACGLLLVACDRGVTNAAARVTDVSAELHGTVHTDDPGITLTWWFEYGTTTELGSTTPERTTTFPAGSTTPRSVTETVTGLAHATTYHYRLCVRNAAGGGLCGATKTLTTTNNRDAVHGLGISYQDLETGLTIGVEVDATSNRNGTSPQGQASRSPGVYYTNVWDAGSVTCLRGEGNQATVGFVADYSMYGLPPVNVVLFVEDNGATGDRFAVDLVDSAPTSCPDPDDLQDAPWQDVIRGDLVVHDHP
jgi:hypothetical protein